ncbi:MAG: hypothetical protein WAQ52_01265 [Terriglobales bacterium]
MIRTGAVLPTASAMRTERAAREDIEHHKRYNSKPRGRFGGRDHGYRREFGSKDRYKAEYTAGSYSGYDSVMRHRY